MSLHRRIEVRMWGDEKFAALSRPLPNAQTLWVYLLTGEHTGRIPGVSRVGEAQLAETLGWSIEDFRKAFAEISAKGMAKADWKARFLFLPNAVRVNPPQSPNVTRGWRREFVELPECPLKSEALAHVSAFVKTLPKTFIQAFEKPDVKPPRKPFESSANAGATATAVLSSPDTTTAESLGEPSGVGSGEGERGCGCGPCNGLDPPADFEALKHRAFVDYPDLRGRPYAALAAAVWVQAKRGGRPNHLDAVDVCPQRRIRFVGLVVHLRGYLADPKVDHPSLRRFMELFGDYRPDDGDTPRGGRKGARGMTAVANVLAEALAKEEAEDAPRAAAVGGSA